nr:uncharacterized protein LOC101952220 isoform X7 [Chrysemys picta bellii]
MPRGRGQALSRLAGKFGGAGGSSGPAGRGGGRRRRSRGRRWAMDGGDGGAEAFVWVNDVLAHSQSVAKARYEFLFGGSETQKPSETGSWRRKKQPREDVKMSLDKGM